MTCTSPLYPPPDIEAGNLALLVTARMSTYVGFILGRGRGLEPVARCRFSGQGRAHAKKLPAAPTATATKQEEEGWEVQ